MRQQDNVYLRLRHKAREGHPRAEELNAAAEAMAATYENYRNQLFDRVSSSPGTAFDEYLGAVRRGHDLLSELDA